jgi:pyruvate/2-oxoglutarate/acetoin dehydrogenase E1 component
MVHSSLEAAEKLSAEGLEAEVMDLRSLLPYDKEMIADTVKKTNRCIVVHEATRTCGFAAEVMAFVAEELFEHLDAPLRRVTSIDTPVPYAPPLEEFFMPNAEKIAAVVREVAGF